MLFLGPGVGGNGREHMFSPTQFFHGVFLEACAPNSRQHSSFLRRSSEGPHRLHSSLLARNGLRAGTACPPCPCRAEYQ